MKCIQKTCTTIWAIEKNNILGSWLSTKTSSTFSKSDKVLSKQISHYFHMIFGGGQYPGTVWVQSLLLVCFGSLFSPALLFALPQCNPNDILSLWNRACFFCDIYNENLSPFLQNDTITDPYQFYRISLFPNIDSGNFVNSGTSPLFTKKDGDRPPGPAAISPLRKSIPPHHLHFGWRTGT